MLPRVHSRERDRYRQSKDQPSSQQGRLSTPKVRATTPVPERQWRALQKHQKFALTFSPYHQEAVTRKRFRASKKIEKINAKAAKLARKVKRDEIEQSGNKKGKLRAQLMEEAKEISAKFNGVSAESMVKGYMMPLMKERGTDDIDGTRP